MRCVSFFILSVSCASITITILPSPMLQISCPVAATGISELCSSLSDRHPRFQAPFFLCLLYNKAPVLFACVLRRGAAGEAAAAQAQVGVRSRTLSLACGMRWRITGYYLPIKGKDNTWMSRRTSALGPTNVCNNLRPDRCCATALGRWMSSAKTKISYDCVEQQHWWTSAKRHKEDMEIANSTSI